MKTITKQVSFTNRDELLNSYFKDLRKTTPLTHEEEINLSARIKNGDQEALNKLVVSNLRFVVTVAKQYQHQGLDLTDLIQCGNEGLIKAARLSIAIIIPTRYWTFNTSLAFLMSLTASQAASPYIALPNNSVKNVGHHES